VDEAFLTEAMEGVVLTDAGGNDSAPERKQPWMSKAEAMNLVDTCEDWVAAMFEPFGL
jgi:hypothetical protein